MCPYDNNSTLRNVHTTVICRFTPCEFAKAPQPQQINVVCAAMKPVLANDGTKGRSPHSFHPRINYGGPQAIRNSADPSKPRISHRPLLFYLIKLLSYLKPCTVVVINSS